MSVGNSGRRPLGEVAVRARFSAPQCATSPAEVIITLSAALLPPYARA